MRVAVRLTNLENAKAANFTFLSDFAGPLVCICVLFAKKTSHCIAVAFAAFLAFTKATSHLLGQDRRTGGLKCIYRIVIKFVGRRGSLWGSLDTL